MKIPLAPFSKVRLEPQPKFAVPWVGPLLHRWRGTVSHRTVSMIGCPTVGVAERRLLTCPEKSIKQDSWSLSAAISSREEKKSSFISKGGVRRNLAPNSRLPKTYLQELTHMPLPGAPLHPTRRLAHLPCQGNLASGFVQKMARPNEVTKPPMPNATQSRRVGCPVISNDQMHAPTTRLIQPQITLVAGLELRENGVMWRFPHIP